MCNMLGGALDLTLLLLWVVVVGGDASGMALDDRATTATKVMKVIRKAQDKVAEVLIEKSEETSKNTALTLQVGGHGDPVSVIDIQR